MPSAALAVPVARSLRFSLSDDSTPFRDALQFFCSKNRPALRLPGTTRPSLAIALLSGPRSERINKWLKQNGIVLLKDGGFNHYRVAQAALPKLTIDSLKPKELAVFEKLSERVSDAF